ncbi:hypothetical protein Pelo_18370 [Pelomyxa schiedti]|nr:hypothetical protein Pelo_18370 [Pelomyxa schiedti]
MGGGPSSDVLDCHFREVPQCELHGDWRLAHKCKELLLDVGGRDAWEHLQQHHQCGQAILKDVSHTGQLIKCDVELVDEPLCAASVMRRRRKCRQDTVVFGCDVLTLEIELRDQPLDCFGGAKGIGVNKAPGNY